MGLTWGIQWDGYTDPNRMDMGTLGRWAHRDPNRMDRGTPVGWIHRTQWDGHDGNTSGAGHRIHSTWDEGKEHCPITSTPATSES